MIRAISGVLFMLAAAAAMAGRPNFVFILADDLGYGELGCYGQALIRTPRLDRMAAEGLRFAQFYAGATVCAPSRSVLMTGQHHGRTRVRGNANKDQPLSQALRVEDVTVAKVLQRAGYRTALVGKWGLGDVGPAECGLPRRQGFDEFYGYLSQVHAHNHFPDFVWRNEQREPWPNEVVPVGDAGGGYATNAVVYADDRFAEECLAFVERNRDRPFFLFWSLVTPHANNERARVLGDGAHVPDYGPYAEMDWPPQDQGHAAMITRLDAHVGRLLDRLGDLGLSERTLVFFSSDNGPHNESRHNPDRFRPSGPLRGMKRSLTEGGIRVPAIAWWPGVIRPGRLTDHVAYLGDWFATVCELAGVEPPSGLDSVSFAPTLRGDEAAQRRHEWLYWEFHERGFSQAALWEGRWKGIREGGLDGPIQLYDLSNDLGETKDVAAAHPEIVARIAAYLKEARTESEDWPIRVRRAGTATGER